MVLMFLLQYRLHVYINTNIIVSMMCNVMKVIINIL